MHATPTTNGTGDAAGEWVTTTSYDDAAAALRAARSVVVVTHVKPDGDAVGSTLAVTRALKHAGIAAEIWFAGPVPRWIGEICTPTPYREIPAGKGVQAAGDPDLCVIVDTGSWTQLGEMRAFLEKRSDRNINLDHHLHGDAAVATRRIVDSSCASCTQVLAPLCTRLLGVASAARLPRDVAEPLYLGLATDTGWLRFSSVTPATLRLAADLLEAGVDHTRLYRLIEQQDVAGRWRLLGRALESLEMHSIHAPSDAATMTLTLRDFQGAGADQNDTSGFADMLLTVSSVEVAAVITETPVPAGEPPLTKFSLRSKPGPKAVDVNAVCQKLGGGGHARAAGAKARVPLAEAKRMLLEALR